MTRDCMRYSRYVLHPGRSRYMSASQILNRSLLSLSLLFLVLLWMGTPTQKRGKLNLYPSSFKCALFLDLILYLTSCSDTSTEYQSLSFVSVCAFAPQKNHQIAVINERQRESHSEGSWTVLSHKNKLLTHAPTRTFTRILRLV